MVLLHAFGARQAAHRDDGSALLLADASPKRYFVINEMNMPGSIGANEDAPRWADGRLMPLCLKR